MLSPQESARADRFVVPGARLLHVAARALLRTTLSLHADVAPERWTFRRDANRKPHLAGPECGSDLRFNLSHTEGLVAVAVTEGCDVGIDVERIAPDVDIAALASVALAPAERAALDAAPETERCALFARFWTLKEAYLKGCGLGLAVDPASVAFDLAREAPRTIFAAPGWSFRQMRPMGEHVLALAVASSNVDVRFTWAVRSTFVCYESDQGFKDRGVTPQSGRPPPPAPAGTTPWRRAS